MADPQDEASGHELDRGVPPPKLSKASQVFRKPWEAPGTTSSAATKFSRSGYLTARCVTRKSSTSQIQRGELGRW